MKICSLLPSATETIFALGLGDSLVAVTSECDFPPAAKSKPVALFSSIDPASMEQSSIDGAVVQSLRAGQGLYTLDRELLCKVKPDLVVTQDLCDVCSVSLKEVTRVLDELSATTKVISQTPRGFQGVLQDILTLGEACGVRDRASRLVSQIRARVESITAATRSLEKRRTFCMEWFDPVFASGHWIPEMVRMAGGYDLLGSESKDSRRIGWDEVVEYDPEVMVLMPCGFGLERTLADAAALERRPGWQGIRAVSQGNVFAVDGSSYFSRPGPRLVVGLDILSRLLHPETFGSDFTEGRAARLVEEPQDVGARSGAGP